MTRDEKIAEAQRLHGEGLTQQVIADRLGMSQSGVNKWLNPEMSRYNLGDLCSSCEAADVAA